MPTKTKEYSLFAPGNLVKSREEMHAVNPDGFVAAGTVGTILRGPEQGYSNRCQVHFVSSPEPWWVRFDEIEPWLP
jgi:hypothetical protein